MPEPPEFITVIDDRGREKLQRVESVVLDVRGEQVFITTDGLNYISDSLHRKGESRLLDLITRIPSVLTHPEIVVWDHSAEDDTLLYYKYFYITSENRRRLFVAIAKNRKGVKFLYNFHLQTSGKVKGYAEKTKPQIWYINPQKRKRQFGL